MEKKQDVRWVQRLNHFEKALDELKSEVELATERDFSSLEKKGVIQSFEIVQELSWKVIKDFYESLGESGIQGSRDAFQLATERNLIENGAVLMQTIKSRNLSSHAYNQEIADSIFHDVIEKFYAAFEELRNRLLEQKDIREM